jgi:Tol biopolymer transport system component
MYVKPTDGTTKEQALDGSDQIEIPTDWSSDGRFLLYTRGDDIWALDLEGDRKAFPVVETMFTELNGQFSPDRRWIAYQSDESGKVEIYVQPFPGPAPKTRISSNGGVQVRWRDNGKELFYVAPDGRLNAVPIRIDSRGVEPGAPVPLFSTPIFGTRNSNSRNYMVSHDGERFLVVILKDVTVPITVILNWKPKS